jgi:hypothetical protein
VKKAKSEVKRARREKWLSEQRAIEESAISGTPLRSAPTPRP